MSRAGAGDNGGTGKLCPCHSLRGLILLHWRWYNKVDVKKLVLKATGELCFNRYLAGAGWMAGIAPHSACWRLDEGCYRWLEEDTLSHPKSTLNFHAVCVKSLRMNGLSVWCCRGPYPGSPVPDPPWERGQQNQSLSWRSPGAVGGPPPPPPRSTMKTSQNKSWHRLNVHLLCLNICRISLLTFLAGFSVVNPPSRIASQTRRVRGLSLHTIHRF